MKGKKIFKSLFANSLMLAFLGLLVLAAIFVWLNSAFGWFAANRVGSGTGMGLDSGTMSENADYYVYIYDVKDDTVHYTGEGRTSSGVSIDPTITNMDMQFHDTIFKQRNRYTPAVVRIEITDLDPARLSGGTVQVLLTRDSSAAYATNPSTGALLLNEKLTSVMRFTLVQNTSYYNANANTLYDNLDTALYTKIVVNKDFTPAGSSGVFTTVTKSGNTITNISKEANITLSTTYSAADIVNGTLNLYLYITYDTDLVTEFESAAGIDTSSSTVGKITTMTDDLETLTIVFLQ